MYLSKSFARLTFAATCLFQGMSAQAHRFDDSIPTHVIEVRVTTKAERNALTKLGYSLEDLRSDKAYIYAHEKDLARIRAAGFIAGASPMKEEWMNIEEMPGPNLAKFHSYEEVDALLQSMAKVHSNIVTLTSLGRSLENRDIPMLRISSKSPAQAESLQLPVAFYMGCHHAREHLSVEVPLMFAQYLVDNYGKDSDVTRLVDSREIYVAPMVNPDGHTYDYTNGIRGKMWRKNRARNSDGTFGVDLNRNYGFYWGTGGSSNDTSSEVYMGPKPFSEPETQHVRDFIDGQPRMTTLLTMHTFSELVLYPWGHSEDKIGQGLGNPADLPVFEKMATTIAGWNHYTPEQASSLYIASGDTTDWAYGVHGIFAFTFELSPSSMSGGGFYPKPTITETVFNANIKPMMYLLEYSDNPRRVLTEKRPPNFNQTPARLGSAIASFKDLQF